MGKEDERTKPHAHVVRQKTQANIRRSKRAGNAPLNVTVPPPQLPCSKSFVDGFKNATARPMISDKTRAIATLIE